MGEVSDPEKLGEIAAIQLLDEIYHCGSVDIRIAPTVLVLMGLSSQLNTSDILLTKSMMNSEYLVKTLRNLNTFFGVKFKIEEPEDQDSSNEDEEEGEGGELIIITHFKIKFWYLYSFLHLIL